jgi:hypothetical protein
MKNIIKLIPALLLLISSCSKDDSLSESSWKINSISVSDTYTNYGFERHEEETQISYNGDTLFYYYYSYDDEYDENVDDYVGIEFSESDTLIGEIYVYIKNNELTLEANFVNLEGETEIYETYSTVIESGEFSSIDSPTYTRRIGFESDGLLKLGLKRINLYCFKEDFNKDNCLLRIDSPVMNFGANYHYEYNMKD